MNSARIPLNHSKTGKLHVAQGFAAQHLTSAVNGSDFFLERFRALHPSEINLSLLRIRRLLADLCSPHLALPPTIHVAGTNGKGSTIAFMRAMLEQSGRRVHVYTSPHLVRFHERIRLAGVSVDEDRLIEAFEEVARVNDGRPITFFEVTTAAAMLLFSREPADALLLEVGLGGQFDATNVIDAPLSCVITPVSLDHQDYLGSDIAKIAREKAGILKVGVPAVIARQDPIALQEIERAATRQGAILSISGRDWHASSNGRCMFYEDGQGSLDLPLPRLNGVHQIENAGAAIAALRSPSTVSCDASNVEAGLFAVEWPGRMERIVTGRLPAILRAGSELWLDGGHNPDGGSAIAATLKSFEADRLMPHAVVVGMLKSKDSDGFLEAFSGLVATIYTVPIRSSSAARSPCEVAAAAERAGMEAVCCSSIEDALFQIQRAFGANVPRVLITGSLYLVGDALTANGTPPP